MRSHKLLKRQIKKFLSDEKALEIEPFLDAIESSYLDLDRNHGLLERSMEISSQELFEANVELKLRSAEIETLYKILTMGSRNTISELIYPSILKEIHQFSEFPILTLELFNERSKTLTLLGHYGVAPEILELHPNLVLAQHTPSGQAIFCSSGSFECGDISPNSFSQSLWSGLKIRSFIGKTLYSESKKPLGVLCLADTQEKFISPRFGSWLDAIAAQIAGVIEKKIMSETMREQEANMISASRMSELGKMAGGVAHEINTPLATIMLLSEQLQESIIAPDAKSSDVKEMAKTITLTAERIAKIVTGLRTFSRDGKNDPMENASLKTLVTSTTSLCSEKFRDNGLALETNIPEGVELMCRETQLSQVILNLLNNSYDAIETNSEKWIKLEYTEEEDNIVLSITDSGRGISEEIQTKLFNPFFTTKPIGKGTGLGLSICIGIITAHHGTLTYNKKSQNTRFDIHFPKSICSFSKKSA